MRIIWKGFVPWVQINYSEKQVQLDEAMDVLNDLQTNVSQTSVLAAIQNSLVAVIVEHSEMYREFVWRDNGDLSLFWLTYIEPVEILLGMVRSSR